MPVDFGNVLHVLAHELRTPIGIAHGYLRLLLDGRLADDAERRRALEQIQKALARVSALSHDTSALAALYEREAGAAQAVPARTLVDRLEHADYDGPVRFESGPMSDAVMIRTTDAEELAQAMITLVRATARESRTSECRVRAVVQAETGLDVLAAAGDDLDGLAAGPDAASATPLSLERGGLGLALVHAALVFEAHGAAGWSVGGSRRTAAVRIPITTGAHA